MTTNLSDVASMNTVRNPTPTIPALEAENLTREYFRRYSRKDEAKRAESSPGRRRMRFTAIEDINLSVDRADVVGYVGLNGAGKSTTIKCLCGVLQPTRGAVRIHGKDVRTYHNQAVRHIGVVFGQKTQLYWDVPALETFKFLKAMWGLSNNDYLASLDELVEVFNIQNFINVPVRQLSLGQRMRCDLVASLLHRPDILFLDEPTVGMDYVSIASFRQHLRTLNASRGTTMMIASHNLEDIEELAKRVIVIDKGKQIFQGSLADLRQKFASYRTVIVESNDRQRLMASLKAENMAHFASAVETDGSIRLNLPHDRSISELTTVLEGGFSSEILRVSPPRLAEVIERVRRSAESGPT